MTRVINDPNNTPIEITGFDGVRDIQERLQEMGLHLGTQLRYVGRAPFKGPLLFRMGTTVIALREEEAQCIQYKVIS